MGPNSDLWSTFDQSSDKVFIDFVNKKASEGKDILLLCNISEALRDLTVNKVHRTLSKLNINPSRILMTTSSLNGPELYEQLCQKNNWNERVNILPANAFLKVSHELARCVIDEYTPKLRLKKFLCFNRVERSHRIILVAKLMLEDLLKNSFYSFYGKDFNNDWLTQLQEIPEQFHDILTSNSNLFPMHLTGNKKTRNNPIELLDTDKQLFEESYYSVVTETLFFQKNDNLQFGTIPAIFFTEKIYKPIAMKHPFILVSVANSLKWLRAMGFKTFSPFINESYDTEENDDLRLQLIVDEIKRLDSLTDQQWMDWQTGIKEIVEHNFKIYNSIPSYAFGKEIDFTQQLT